MNFGLNILNTKMAFLTRVASIYSCSVTADVIGKEAKKSRLRASSDTRVFYPNFFWGGFSVADRHCWGHWG